VGPLREHQPIALQNKKKNLIKLKLVQFRKPLTAVFTFTSLFLPFDIRLFVQIVFGLMLIGYNETFVDFFNFRSAM
jgi:hypothetical protein